MTADTVDDVTLSRAQQGLVEITHHGDASEVIYVRSDGIDPAVADSECDVVLPGQRVTIASSGSGQVRLISAGVPTYTLAVLR